MIYKYALLFINILKSFKNRIFKNALSREATLNYYHWQRGYIEI